MSREMDVETIKTNLSSPARTYLWEFFVPNMPGGGDIDSVRTRCVISEMPNVASEPITVDWRAMKFKVAGKMNYGHTITLTFLESEDVKIIKALYNWRALVIDPATGTGGQPNNYKADAYLELLDTQGSVYLDIRLIGSYPEDVPTIGLDMSSTDLIKPTLTLSYDRWVLQDAATI